MIAGINIAKATEGLKEPGDSLYARELDLSRIRFLNLLLDYADPQIDTSFIPKELENDQIEDWLLGRAVKKTLDSNKRFGHFWEDVDNKPGAQNG